MNKRKFEAWYADNTLTDESFYIINNELVFAWLLEHKNSLINLFETKLDEVSLTNSYKTRDGKKVKLFHIFNAGEVGYEDRRVYGAVLMDNAWVSVQWCVDGSYKSAAFKSPSCLDLIESINID